MAMSNKNSKVAVKASATDGTVTFAIEGYDVVAVKATTSRRTLTDGASDGAVVASTSETSVTVCALAYAAHNVLRPASILFSIWNPAGECDGTLYTLKSEATVGEALRAAEQNCREVKAGEQYFALRDECLHRVAGQLRRSESSYDPKEEKFFYMDPESGEERELSSSSFLVLRALSPTSVLPTSPRGVPSIVVFNNAVFLEENAARQLVPASAGMTSAVFVALQRGVRCGQRKFYWELRGGDFVDSTNGAVFPQEEIPDGGERSHVVCLLRRGDRPPLCRVPDGMFLKVFHRISAQVLVEHGRLQASELPEAADMQRWQTSYRVDQFDEDFTASARQK